jgi:hypothetical protein
MMMPALLFAATLTCAAPQSTQLVGLWESKERSNGGIGHTVEFRPDGSYVEATSVLVDMYYRVSAGRLTISEKPIVDVDTTAAGDSFPIKIEGDTLTQQQPAGPRLRKERVGHAEPGKDPIVGIWRFRHPTGGTAYERYTPDGQIYFRMPMTSSVGCYKLDGQKLALTRAKEGGVDGTFEMKGEDLVLNFAGKDPGTYTKEPAGPWYEREKVDVKPPR